MTVKEAECIWNILQTSTVGFIKNGKKVLDMFKSFSRDELLKHITHSWKSLAKEFDYTKRFCNWLLPSLVVVEMFG